MLYFKLQAGHVVEISADYPTEIKTAADGGGSLWARQPGREGLGDGWANRNDFTSFEQAQSIAASAWALVQSRKEERNFIATDAGPNVSPRFDVNEAPKLGDPVSYGFNGDSYPDGTITFIGKNYSTIRTSEGHTYYRKRLTGSWKQPGGTWSLLLGHRNDYNPSF